MTQSIKKVYVVQRQDPLDDFDTLAKIGRSASRSARAKARKQGVSFTFAKAGRVIKQHPDGSEQLVRIMSELENFQSLQADLCQD